MLDSIILKCLTLAISILCPNCIEKLVKLDPTIVGLSRRCFPCDGSTRVAPKSTGILGHVNQCEPKRQILVRLMNSSL